MEDFEPFTLSYTCPHTGIEISVWCGDDGKAEDEDDVPRRKFELCKLDEDFNIDECEVIYDEDLVNVLGAEQAARIISDPTALDVFFQLPL